MSLDGLADIQILIRVEQVNSLLQITPGLCDKPPAGLFVRPCRRAKDLQCLCIRFLFRRDSLGQAVWPWHAFARGGRGLHNSSGRSLVAIEQDALRVRIPRAHFIQVTIHLVQREDKKVDLVHLSEPG